MYKKILLKRTILLLIGMFAFGFSVFAQKPYNVVMNIPQDPKTQMAFNWFTGVGITGGEVQIMLNGNTITIPATCTQYPGYTVNKAVITGLSPNTTYSFHVGGVNNNWSDIGTFTTAKTNKDPFSFVYITDSQVGDSSMLRTNAKAAFTKYPDAKFWLHCGDMNIFY